MSNTGTAYKDASDKYVGRIEVDHQVPIGRASGGTSYYYGALKADDWLLKFFANARAFRVTGGRWRMRKLDKALILDPALAALFPHESLGLTPIEAPL